MFSRRGLIRAREPRWRLLRRSVAEEVYLGAAGGMDQGEELPESSDLPSASSCAWSVCQSEVHIIAAKQNVRRR